ncbi:hypothetical protein [Winogradskyella sp.]|uniref:hypothetical protein n=1 Tax=Winogradskyella sp. TaxID=1883156 RepID=UPI00261D80AF|nr:hypothetical protein [Winogradskyella sp.]
MSLSLALSTLEWAVKAKGQDLATAKLSCSCPEKEIAAIASDTDMLFEFFSKPIN